MRGPPLYPLHRVTIRRLKGPQGVETQRREFAMAGGTRGPHTERPPRAPAHWAARVPPPSVAPEHPMSRIRLIAVGVAALLVILALASMGNTPTVAPAASPAGSIAQEGAVPSVTSSASLKATMGASQKPTQTRSVTV